MPASPTLLPGNRLMPEPFESDMTGGGLLRNIISHMDFIIR